MKTLTPGTPVIVEAAGNRKLSRRVVEDRGEVVLITTEEEFENAGMEGREPISVGFRREWVHSEANVTPRKSARSEVPTPSQSRQFGD